MKKIIILSVLVSAALNIFAQPINKSSYETMLLLAEEAKANSDYYNALQQYEKAYEEREDNALVPVIAEMYYLISDYAKAERFLVRALRKDKDKELVNARLQLGRTYKINGKYDDAITVLQEYIGLIEDPVMKQLAQNEITGAELALSGATGASKGVTVTLLDKVVNSPFSEYSPMIASEGKALLFASAPADGVIIVDDANDPEKYIRIFNTAKSETSYSKPEPLGEGINRPGFHSANVSLSPDGRRMFFNRIELKGNTPGTAKIYLSERGEDGWKSANEVTGVNGEWLALHPVVGELFGQEVLFLFFRTMVQNVLGCNGVYMYTEGTVAAVGQFFKQHGHVGEVAARTAVFLWNVCRQQAHFTRLVPQFTVHVLLLGPLVLVRLDLGFHETANV